MQLKQPATAVAAAAAAAVRIAAPAVSTVSATVMLQANPKRKMRA
jgi:hypothetical protein